MARAQAVNLSVRGIVTPRTPEGSIHEVQWQGEHLSEVPGREASRRDSGWKTCSHGLTRSFVGTGNISLDCYESVPPEGLRALVYEAG